MIITSFIGDHKPECAIGTAGGVLGGLAGRQIYKKMPSAMTKTVYENGKRQEVVTKRFINYAVKSYKKDLFSTIDPHTERGWLEKQMLIIKQDACGAIESPAKNNWKFQQLYDFGMDFLTGRKHIDGNNMGLAKRGANAIKYGQKVEQGFMIGICAILTSAAFIGAKLLYDKKHDNNDKNSK